MKQQFSFVHAVKISVMSSDDAPPHLKHNFLTLNEQGKNRKGISAWKRNSVKFKEVKNHRINNNCIALNILLRDSAGAQLFLLSVTQKCEILNFVQLCPD